MNLMQLVVVSQENKMTHQTNNSKQYMTVSMTFLGLEPCR